MKKSTWFAGILIFGTFVMILLTLHDMQTAQGIGLYLSILGGYKSRIIFDILVDVLGIVLLAIGLFVPCFLLGRLKVNSLFRLLASYLALLPGVDLGRLVHIFDPPGVFSLRQSFVEGEFLTAFLAGMGEISPVLRLWLPILCLMFMGNRMIANTGIKRWVSNFFLIQIPLLLGVFLFPVIAPFLSFIMQYLLLIVCFDIWEGWYKVCSNIEIWGTILFGGLWLRGIYLMIEVMSIWAI